MTATATAAPLVDPGWIAERIDDESVRLIEVDVAQTAYRAGHIPGALLWNIYADLRRPDYTPIGTRELQELLCSSGVSPETTLVFYGYGAHLGYWLLRSHGHRDARVLDGPREQWLEVAGGWSLDEPVSSPAVYHLSAPDSRLYVGLDDMLDAVGQPGTVLLDVRSGAEFDGERFWPSGATEDAGRAGHIPGSIHLPIDEIRTESGYFRSPGEIRDALRARGVTADRRIVVYCTVGNRAGQCWYALTHLLDYEHAGVYHGSWAEWGKLPGAPIELRA